MTDSKPDLRPNLKKNDLLAAIAMEPTTKAAINESLEPEYRYIPSYLDYLLDHFVALGKIEEVDIDGEEAYVRKVGKTGKAGPREYFRVVINDDGNGDYELEQTEIAGNPTDEQKAEGWKLGAKAAIKAAKSAVFAEYKDATTAISNLLPKDSK